MRGKRNGAEKSLHVRKLIEAQNYTLINEYIHEKTVLQLVCPNGHSRTCMYEAFKRGKCQNCKNEKALQVLINSIEALEYEFVKYPENARDIGIAYCSKGHLREAKAHNFLNFKCGECTQKNTPKSIELCRQVFLSRGFELLENAYINCKTFMKYKCSCGEINKTTLDILLHSEINSCNKCKGKKMAGENHHNWKGGYSPPNRTTPEYRRWRKAILTRDFYTCRCCSIRGGNLEAHHINNYSSNKGIRYNISNGITLCVNCHSLYKEGSFHRIYGAHNNDIYQLQEYFDIIRSKLNLPLVKIENIIS